MPLSRSDRAELDRLGVDNVRQRLDSSGPGGGAFPLKVYFSLDS
jgi:hypothetical protein